MAEKIIRDPVHDVIAFWLDRPVDALLFKLLNASEFQRLRRVHQLGMATLAYPGAEHSRYSHSLGVMQTARRILDQLRGSIGIDEETETACLVAALLHDLGHGPLSHAFERVSGIHHERMTQRVIMDPDAEVHRILISHNKLMPERVVNLLQGKPQRQFASDILSSQLDADRLDYLLRDNYMTGSRYGDYDLTWLLHAFTVDPEKGRLAVSWKGVSAVEAYLQSRYHMYRNVYFHKVVRGAEGMMKLALQRAKRLAIQDRLEWPPRDNGVFKALIGQRLSMDEFRDLDDVSLWHCFKLWATAGDNVLAALCRGLLYRDVYKTIELTHRFDADGARQFVQRAQAAVAAAGGEEGYDLFFDEPSDTPGEDHPIHPSNVESADDILVVDSSGAVRRFSEISPMNQLLERGLVFRRLHVKPQWKQLVESLLRS